MSKTQILSDQEKLHYISFAECYQLPCVPQNSYAEAPVPTPLNVTAFGDRAFKGLTELK